MAFGVTPEGFVRPTVQEIKEELERDELASIDPTLDIATDPVVGQMNGIFAQQLGKAWEALEGAYDGLDPDKAEDDQLAALSKLSGTNRDGARPSEVDCDCNFENAGVELTAGVHFAHVLNRPDLRFTPKETFTSTAAGTSSIRFRCEQTGPIAVAAGSLTVIATSVVGWVSINNPGDATVGSNVENDAELRLRREAEVARRGAATLAAIRSDVSAVAGVEQVRVFENRLPSLDEFGQPPHSFEVVISGDSADDDEIAQAIWDSRPAGIRDFSAGTGATTGQAIDDLGDSQVMHFSRAASVQIWISFGLTVGTDYVGDAAFREAIAAFSNELHDINETVIASRIRALPFEIAELGVLDVVTFGIGLGPSPTLALNIPINRRQRARFDTSRVAVTT